MSDAFYGYSGAATGRNGELEYHRLYDPFPAPRQEGDRFPGEASGMPRPRSPGGSHASSSSGHVTPGHADPDPIPPSPGASSLAAGDGH